MLPLSRLWRYGWLWHFSFAKTVVIAFFCVHLHAFTCGLCAAGAWRTVEMLCKTMEKKDTDHFEQTNAQFRAELEKCRKVFRDKLGDYGASWRIFRQTTVADQLFIKAKRIRNLEEGGQRLVDEGIYPEFQGLVNYGIVGLIQLELGAAWEVDLDAEEALAHYDRHADEALRLMVRKNHDYAEAWRGMMVSSYTDLILTKIARIKEIERHAGFTLVSEGVDANLMDIINYAMFGLIKMDEAAAG